MVDGPDRRNSISAITSQLSRLSFHLLICTDGSFLSHWAVFSFQTRGDFGGYLVWHSHPPPVLIPAHAMKQNTGDMSGSKALSGCQKHLPKYLHLLLLFIHHQCGSLDLLLVFGEHPLSQSSLIPGKVRKKKERKEDTLSLSVCILRQS